MKCKRCTIIQNHLSTFDRCYMHKKIIGDSRSAAADDRRRLIFARRMATRKRAGPACIACKTRRIKCSTYRPCHRCLTLSIDCCHNEKEKEDSKNCSQPMMACTRISSQNVIEAGISPKLSDERWLVCCGVLMDTSRRQALSRI